MRLLPVLPLALSFARSAVACDLDGDGYLIITDVATCSGYPGELDCNDGDATRNPGEPENPFDDEDDDCDGSKVVHRAFVSSFDFAFVPEWILTSATLNGAGGLRLSPTASDAATAYVNGDVPWGYGELHALVKVSSDTTSGCSILVQPLVGPPTSRGLAVGLNDLTFANVEPGDTIGTLRIACDAGAGNAVVDWITLQNGSYAFAPLGDVEATANTMALPNAGRQSVLRTTEDQSLIMVGSDVGGVGWSTNGTDWTANNGGVGDLGHAGDLGVWEVYGETSSELFALTGSWDSGDGGGLYLNEALADDWTRLAPTWGLGASKHIDDCDNLGGKLISSGRLIVPDPITGADQLYVASADPDSRGLYLVDWNSATNTADVCEPWDAATLPTMTGIGYDALPSALAPAVLNDGSAWVLVGYKTLAYGAVTDDHTSLYLCPSMGDLGYDCSTLPTGTALDDCWPVDDGDVDWNEEETDVRDIEVDPDPERPGRFYLVDGGIRYSGLDGSSNTTCVAEEPTIRVVDVTMTGFGPVFDVWDTDDDDPLHDKPSWNNNGGPAQTYQSANACPQGSYDLGELVAPKAAPGTEPATLSTIAIDPEGEFLFTFYGVGSDTRDYGCVHAFRVAAADAVEGATPWRPLQDYEYGNMSYLSSNAAERRGVVDANGAFFEDEPLLEVWAPGAAHDAIFVQTSNFPSPTWALYVGANYIWRVNDGAWGVPGWATTGGDLDYIPWQHAWGGGDTFQDAATTSVAACQGCDIASAISRYDRVRGGIGDIGGAELYGTDNPATRTPAWRECPFHTIGSTAKSVDYWIDPAGELPPQAWHAMVDQASYLDPNLRRAILFDDGSGAWCWDAPAVGPRDAFDGVDATGEYVLACQDSDLSNPLRWPTCAPDPGDPFHMIDPGSEVGWPAQILGIAEDTALVVAKNACVDLNCVEGDANFKGAGLFVVRYDLGAQQLTYTKVDFDTSATCTSESMFFDGTGSGGSKVHSQNHLTLHPDSDPSGSGKVRAFVSSRTCGLREVKFTLGSETVEASTVWTDVSLASCTMPHNVLRGVSVSSGGEYAYAYGGLGNGLYTGGGVCAVDLTTAAPYGAQQAVPYSLLQMESRALLPHPHIDGVFYVGGVTSAGCTACDWPALYAVERRFRPYLGNWDWHTRQLSGDDLEVGQINGLDWGGGLSPTGTPYLDRIYLATAGGGIWDVGVSW